MSYDQSQNLGPFRQAEINLCMERPEETDWSYDLCISPSRGVRSGKKNATQETNEDVTADLQNLTVDRQTDGKQQLDAYLHISRNRFAIRSSIPEEFLCTIFRIVVREFR